jgi:oligopeptide/dipeptide ABC transporter ATP-binding protein
MTALLEVDDLRIFLDLPGASGSVQIVDGVDFAVQPGQVFGLAGESGCGKTITALSLLQLLPPRARTSGRALFEGHDLLTLPPTELRALRGRKVAMVFQDPTSSLHPMLTIERQLTEHLLVHLHMDRKQAHRRALALLEEVRIPDPETALRGYPHQFSGGMRQRIQIAMALACEPTLLIADEPTTALDVTVQAGILRLLDRLCRASGLAVILITHDLGVLSALADTVAVMYAGRLVETGPTSDVLQHSRHPYTRGLLESLPHPEAADLPLVPIRGTAATPVERPGGCAFHPRCAFAMESCRREVPPLIELTPGRRVACPVDPFPASRPNMGVDSPGDEFLAADGMQSHPDPSETPRRRA